MTWMDLPPPTYPRWIPPPPDGAETDAELLDRLMTAVEKTDTCWLWSGSTNKRGYGLIGARGQWWLVHRLVYVLTVGPIPDGLTIDHVRARGCTHKNCVNPTHLEAVTQAENSRRANTKEG